MENATKALMIAAGMLFAIMVVTLLVMAFNSISNYFQSQDEQTKIVQLAEFNQQFENYTNDDIRGSDLLSLANKAIDYNTRVVQEDTGATGYIKVSINVKMGNNLTSFHYLDKGKLINNSKLSIDGLRSISSTAQAIENTYGSVNEAGKLSANIHKFISNDNEEAIAELNRILNKNNIDKENLTTVKEHALTYYEITQFKRAHFKCTNTKYDKDTGRIIEMNFIFTGKFE